MLDFFIPKQAVTALDQIDQAILSAEELQKAYVAFCAAERKRANTADMSLDQRTNSGKL